MTTPAALLSHRGMHDGSRGVDPASLRARARLRATLRASRLFPARSRTVAMDTLLCVLNASAQENETSMWPDCLLMGNRDSTTHSAR